MPRDRKAVEARKKQARQEEQISRRNEYGFMDSTAYEALRAITREEEQKKRAAHGERGRQF